jgi:hypothetical protein
MITNTDHFVSRAAAERYYEYTGEPKEYVERAIKEERITIGAPKYDALRQSLRVNDGRYQIVDCEHGYRVGDLHG